MQVTETNAEGLKREFKVVFGAAEIEGKVLARLEDMKGTVQLPGFRPGKVPVNLLRQRFGKSVMGEVVQEALNTGAEEAIKTNDLKPAMQPKIEVTSFDEGADLEYTVALEVLPDIEPGDLSTLELERLKTDVDDETVEERLGRLAEQQRRFTEAPAKHKAAAGDALLVDFTGSIDGESFEGGSAQDFTLVIGDNELIPGFGDQLLGAKAGDHVTVTVTFPDAYRKELAGKTAAFEVDVKEIRRPEEVKVDDELATQLGLESLDDLRKAIREQVEREYAALSRARVKRNLLDALAGRYDFELPPGLVDSEFDSIWQQIEHDREHGHPDPELEGKSDDEIKEEFRDIAERRVRLGLLLSEVGRRNNIEVQQEEMNRAIAERARQLPGGQQQRAFDYFMNNSAAAAQLQAPIFEDKVVDFILEMAAVTERSVLLEELTRDPDEASEAVADDTAPKKPARKKAARKTTAAKSGSTKRKAKAAKAAPGPAKDAGAAPDEKPD